MKTKYAILLFMFVLSPFWQWAQCTWYTVTVNESDTSDEITWQLIDANGVQWLTGGAPYEEDVCLPDGCYTLVMYDLAGNGWEDEDWKIEDWIGEFDFDTNLPNGFQGYDIVDLGDNGCADVPPGEGGNGCTLGTNEYTLTISPGTDPTDISWQFTLGGSVISQGNAPDVVTLCLGNGCFFMTLLDSESDGWEGATYTLTDDGGSVVASGTMASGSEEDQLINIGGLDCSNADPDGGGGGGGGPIGEGCGNNPPTSDCSVAPCVCDPYVFNISPSGSGSIYEIPSPGSVSNPSYGPSNNAPWGGTDWGCLLAGELNSNWMMFTVGTTGTLEFSFGAGGEQSGYYDWAMWPYDANACADIAGNSLSPARCVWNAVSWGGTGLASSIPAGGNAGNYGPPLNVTAGDQFIFCLSNWSYVNDEVTLDFFGSATIDCNLLLPVEWLDLKAIQIGSDVRVSWKTMSESNNDYFMVQGSRDLQNWFDIERVEGAGNSYQQRNYEALHIDPAPGIVYYRILQVDYNGQVALSDEVSVDIRNRAQIVVVPNPADEQVSIHYSGVDCQLDILDASGRVVYRQGGEDLFPLVYDCTHLPDGLYHIVISDRTRIRQEKLIINHD